MMKRLVLEDGTVFSGNGFGSEKDVIGEIVFQTGMTGYQEVMSDPSYYGQIITFTYPSIGNYGVNRDDFETIFPSLSGVVVKEHCEYPSNFRNEETLDSFLKARGIPGISGIDTRELTKIIRETGTMKAVITSSERNVREVLEEMREYELPTDQVASVSTDKPYVIPHRGERIVVVDYGMKNGLLRAFTERGCHITVVPYNTSAEEIMRQKPDGVFLSNGPGNPAHIPEATETVRKLIGKVPVFGVCMGHQVIARACGARTEKLPFGHRGVNQPVFDKVNDRTYMTSQNHGYSVDYNSIMSTELKITQYSLNDDTVEALEHARYPVFSVQYHPESTPGPEDTGHLFDRFLSIVRNWKEETYVRT
ncbi:carbamoyl-phosphate synthase small subunit [Salimicrobium album]|uniref:Carbamoyl phosphate synthase small chain n=3 Tax=Bacillaceae TaxID=186817 RepID=A0ABY1KPP4_9BACI|nr:MULTISPECIES: glutamine-hydrolyzing carbamoyl-phosphate synthase small subunit [Salimicrobium]SDX33191.1 carbamoyl-phosphate synthase small subunit [Salimicrobium album]SIS61973.1 carbamoyl-phosphate synthase small subunit [Salimicrobium salexigens]